MTTDREAEIEAAGEFDLRPFGYAPGNYLFKCHDCSEEEQKRNWPKRTAAKLTIRCREHALAAALRAEQAKSREMDEAAS